MLRYALVVLVCIGLLPDTSFAQKSSGCREDLVPKLSENKNWGYADLFGQWVIEPIYTKVSPFVEGRAIVQRGTLSGVIDCEGNVVLQCKYEKLTNFREGKVWAMEKGLWGLIGPKGQIFQVPQYAEINPIAWSALAWVKKENVWGLFSEERNSFLCRPQYKMVQVMSLNASLVQTDQLYGVVNHVNCQYLLPLELTKVKKLAPHDIIFEEGGKWGVFNDIGKTILNPEYDTILLKTEELLEAKKGNRYGLFGLRGQAVLPVVYDSIGTFSDGFFLLKQGDRYGYCNRLGKVYIKPEYEAAKDFQNKQAVVKKGGKWGIIDYANRLVLPALYENIESGNGFYVIAENGKNYFYDLRLKKLSEQGFESIAASDIPAAVRVKENGRYAFIHALKQTYLSTERFEEAASFEEGYAYVVKDGKKGVLDLSGTLVVPCRYDEVRKELFQSKTVFSTWLQGKAGLVDPSGKVLLNNEFEEIVPALPNFLKVKKGGKYAIYRTSGVPVTGFVYDYLSSQSDLPGAPEWPAIATQKGKSGLINEKGEEVYPIKARTLVYAGEQQYVAAEGKKQFLVGLLGRSLPLSYEEVKMFGNGLAAARKGVKWGYITTEGTEKIKLQYEEAGKFENKLAAVRLKGKWGVIDRMGKWVIPAEYDSFEQTSTGERKFYKAGKEYVLLPNGILR
jgi:hypothetical protein